MPKQSEKRTDDRPVQLGLITRTAHLGIRAGSPASLDRESRSVEVVAATEQPVRVYDWRRGLINEVLLMSGLEDPPSQVPLLDTHWGYSTDDVLGSLREIKVSGQDLVGRIKFSSLDRGDRALTQVAEGHVTDVSVGYTIGDAVWIEDGETSTVEGRQYQGPVRVVTRWRVHELSLCPIGADDAAKVRAANMRKEPEMDKRLRDYLESRGLAKDATEEQAWQYLQELEGRDASTTQPDPPADPEPANDTDPPADPPSGARNTPAPEGQEAYRAASEIVRMCRALDVDDETMLEHLRSGKAPAEVALALLAADGERSGIQGGAGYRPPARVQADERDKFRAAGQDAILLRGGLTVDSPAPGADELRGYTLREMARECLRRANVRAPGDIRDMVGRALTTTDLPNLLASTANRSLMMGFDAAEETWDQWCGEGSVADFREQTGVRLGEFPDLDEIKQEGEYTYGTLGEATEKWYIRMYGKALRISRQAIINDDLGALTERPQIMGEAAARTVGDVAYTALLANVVMGDGIDLFHANHGNVASMANFGVDGLGAAVLKMMQQKDMEGKRRLNIKPQFFIAPTTLALTAETFFGSTLIGTQEQPNIVKPKMVMFQNRVYEGRLDDDDPAVFYLAAAKGKTVMVYFLNGEKRPFMDQELDWNSDGAKFKVRIDVGAKARDWRGLVKATITG